MPFTIKALRIWFEVFFKEHSSKSAIILYKMSHRRHTSSQMNLEIHYQPYVFVLKNTFYQTRTPKKHAANMNLLITASAEPFRELFKFNILFLANVHLSSLLSLLTK